ARGPSDGGPFRLGAQHGVLRTRLARALSAATRAAEPAARGTGGHAGGIPERTGPGPGDHCRTTGFLRPELLHAFRSGRRPWGRNHAGRRERGNGTGSLRARRPARPCTHGLRLAGGTGVLRDGAAADATAIRGRSPAGLHHRERGELPRGGTQLTGARRRPDRLHRRPSAGGTRCHDPARRRQRHGPAGLLHLVPDGQLGVGGGFHAAIRCGPRGLRDRAAHAERFLLLAAAGTGSQASAMNTAAAGVTSTGAQRPVSTPWLVCFGGAWFGFWLIVMLPGQFMVVKLAGVIDPQHKVSVSSALIAVMAAVIVVSVPVVGWLCDRSRPRWGRRRTWALAGLITATVPFAFVGVQSHPWTAGILLAVVALGEATVLVSLSAVIADQVPQPQRGRASAAMGVPQVIALAGGMVLVTELITAVSHSWLAVAVLALLTPPPFLFGFAEPPAPARRPRTH